MKIGVSMIVKNEEEMLPVCLKTIKDFDEIVIVDTGSTDNTVAYLKEINEVEPDLLKISIDDYKWNDNFSEARNFARQFNKADWILTIDADEELLTGYDEIKKWVKEAEDKGYKTINVMMKSKGGESFYFPRLSKNIPEIKYKGRVHNLLTHDDVFLSDIQILYKYSPAHEKDKDREIRMLTKALEDNNKDVRVLYYLAKTLFKKKDIFKARYFFEEVIRHGAYTFYAHDTYFHLAKIYINLGLTEEAKIALMKALMLNLQFKEAWGLYATLVGPKNKVKALEIAETATNEGIMFIRNEQKKQMEEGIEPNGKEKGKEYYDKLFTGGYDTTRYSNIYKRISGSVAGKSALDIGCGVGTLFQHIDGLRGFDLSSVAVAESKKVLNEKLDYEMENARKKIIDGRVWEGNVYDKKNYEGGYEYYITTEVLEHLENDIEVIKNIPSGKKIIFSVPSFPDPSHVRTYTEDEVWKRYEEYIKIENIKRYDWNESGQMWEEMDNRKGNLYILLCEGIKK